jgi:hypothetical protein
MGTALKCPNCSAPLPTPNGGAFALCGYCGTTAQLGQADAPTAPGQREREAPGRYPNGEDRANFGSAYAACTLAGQAFVPALEDAARSSLATYGDQRAMVYTVAHLITDFERDTGASVRGDPLVIGRVVQAYYQVADEIAHTGPSQINLPFLAVAASCPVHLSRTLSADDLARMGSGPPPAAPDPPPAPMPAPEPAPKKKKGWFS